MYLTKAHKNLSSKSKNNLNITVVDFGMGNIFSVVKALELFGATITLTDDLDFIRASQVLILPGDGAFGAAIENLKQKKILPLIKEHVLNDKWLFGICVGFQLLFEESEEFGIHRGLGIFPGKVKKFRGNFTIPHMGWNGVSIQDENHPILKGLKKSALFYFIHSYFAQSSQEKSTLGTCDYYGKFTAIAGQGRVFGTQFHPEKSHEDGLQIIKNFCNLVAKENSTKER